MKATDLCRRGMVSLPATASVRDAARTMREEHVGAVVVTDPRRPPLVRGIVTDRDLVVDVLAVDAAADTLTLGELCHGVLAGVKHDASLRETVEALNTAGVRRLFVFGDDYRITGLLSMDDVLEALGLEFQALVGALRGEAARERQRVGPHEAEEGKGRALYLPGHEP